MKMAVYSSPSWGKAWSRAAVASARVVEGDTTVNRPWWSILEAWLRINRSVPSTRGMVVTCGLTRAVL